LEKEDTSMRAATTEAKKSVVLKEVHGKSDKVLDGKHLEVVRLISLLRPLYLGNGRLMKYPSLR